MTAPIAVVTTISPLDKPLISGNKINKLRPISSTVTVKSVPLIAMFAVGVLRSILFLSILFRLPVINLAVPKPKVIAILDLLGLGSKMYSSMVSCECSVSFTCESSKNLIAIRPSVVTASSFCWMLNASSALYCLSLTTLASPLNSDMFPTSTACACTLVVLNDANSTIITVRYNFKPVIILGA